ARDRGRRRAHHGQARPHSRRHHPRPRLAAWRDGEPGPHPRPRSRPLSLGALSMLIGILGGTGKEGAGLALRWAEAGHEVIIGSRDADPARAKAQAPGAAAKATPA